MRGGRWSWYGVAILVVASVASLVMAPDRVAWSFVPSWSSALGSLTSVFTWVPSALAGWSAWQGWRHRRSNVDHAPVVRTRLRVSADWYAPAWAAAVVLPMVVIAWMAAHTAGAPRPVDLLMVPVAILLLGFWSLFGAALGRTMPVALAVPLSVIAAFFGVAYPEALSDMAVRHVAGLHSSCCLLQTSMDARLLVAPLVFYLVAAGLALWVVLVPSRRRAAAAIAGSVVVFLGCYGLVRPISTVNGEVARDPAQLVCAGERPLLCLWPEQLHLREQIHGVAAHVTASMAAQGIGVPSTVTVVGEAEWVYAAGSARRTDAEVAQSLINGLVVPAMPACSTRQPWFMTGVFDDQSAWVWLTAGFDKQRVQVSPTLTKVLARPHEAQVAWFKANFAKRSLCGVQPTP